MKNTVLSRRLLVVAPVLLLLCRSSDCLAQVKPDAGWPTYSNDPDGTRFSPAQQIQSIVSYEIWMVGGTLFFIGLAAFFFYVYGGRKAAAAAGVL